MADGTNPTDSAPADGAPSTGELLRHAREQKGLTIQQVAQALHLDAWILEALESNRFKDIGAPVFVKGHLRKFAAEVGLGSDAIMEAYYRSEDTPDTPRLVTDTLNRPAGDGRGRAPVIGLSVLLVLLIALVAWLWLRGQSLGFPRGDAEKTANPPVAEDNAVQLAVQPPQITITAEEAPELSMDVSRTGGDGREQEADLPDADAIDLGAAESVTAASAAQETAVERAAPAAETGLLSMSINFANDSWVEIYDRSNRRLFFDLGKAGTRRTVTGEPPLQVLLGNAEEARITVNGEPFTIPAGSRRGKTARFSVQ